MNLLTSELIKREGIRDQLLADIKRHRLRVKEREDSGHKDGTDIEGVSRDGMRMEGFRICDDAPLLAVNEHGIVRRVVDGRAMKPIPDPDGYERVGTNIDGKRRYFRIHRLVATAFIPNPENKPHVNHKDGIKNNNKLVNLEWCTQKENFAHAKAVLRVGMHKFTVDSILMGKLQHLIDTLEKVKRRPESTVAQKDMINRALRRVREH